MKKLMSFIILAIICVPLIASVVILPGLPSPIGAENQVVTVVSGMAEWATPASGGDSFMGTNQPQFSDSLGDPDIDADWVYDPTTNLQTIEQLSLDGGPVAGTNTVSATDDVVADANTAGVLAIHASNKTAGTGDGGNLTLNAGTSAGGLEGTIEMAESGSGFVVSRSLTAVNKTNGNSGPETSAGNEVGFEVDIDWAPSGTGAFSHRLVFIEGDYTNTLENTNRYTGITVRPRFRGTANLTNLEGIRVNADYDGSGSGDIVTYAQIRTLPVYDGSGTVTSAYGLFLDAAVGAATVTNKYGLFQIDSDHMNVFAGDVRFGGVTDPTVPLDVTGNALISGSLGIGATATSKLTVSDTTDVDVRVDQTGANATAGILLDSDRTANNAILGQVATSWNGVQIGRMEFRTGTTSGALEDDGIFAVSVRGTVDANPVEKFRIEGDGQSFFVNDLNINDTVNSIDLDATAGSVYGSATGGAQGAGTINAVGVFDDGVLLTDFVFEEGYKQKTIDEMQEFYQKELHLPTIEGRDSWETKRFSLGKVTTMLWETVEVQAKYIAELDDRNDSLEERIEKLEAALSKLIKNGETN